MAKEPEAPPAVKMDTITLLGDTKLVPSIDTDEIKKSAEKAFKEHSDHIKMLKDQAEKAAHEKQANNPAPAQSKPAA